MLTFRWYIYRCFISNTQFQNATKKSLVLADHKQKFTPSPELSRPRVPSKLGLDHIEFLRPLRICRADTLINILFLKDSRYFFQRLALRLGEEEVNQAQYNYQTAHVNGEISPPQRIKRNRIHILIEKTRQRISRQGNSQTLGAELEREDLGWVGDEQGHVGEVVGSTEEE